MKDFRMEKLADVLINHSVRLQKGEKVLIEAIGVDGALVKEIIKKAYAAGGYPYVNIIDNDIQRTLLMGTSEEHLAAWTDFDGHRMDGMDAYIGVRGGANSYELSDVPADKMKLYSTLYSHPVHHERRVKNTKWVVLRYPNPSMAQLSSMSTEAFEDFYYDVCTLDYSKMDRAMDALKELMEKTDKVRIVGNGTDLSFSIKGIPAIKCAGEMNIPDGEIYTAPVKDSVNGVIRYNAPSIEHGLKHENVTLTFENGKIVKEDGNYPEVLHEIFNTDEGARYVGEFAIGVNPFINSPMGDILFDEKIAGSIHFTPGASYDDASNGNNSAVHWDLVLIQTPEYGGGEIYFDGRLIRKDGRFVAEELLGLNPENLR
jgi:aminopeptidase